MVDVEEPDEMPSPSVKIGMENRKSVVVVVEPSEAKPFAPSIPDHIEGILPSGLQRYYQVNLNKTLPKLPELLSTTGHRSRISKLKAQQAAEALVEPHELEPLLFAVASVVSSKGSFPNTKDLSRSSELSAKYALGQSQVTLIPLEEPSAVKVTRCLNTYFHFQVVPHKFWEWFQRSQAAKPPRETLVRKEMRDMLRKQEHLNFFRFATSYYTARIAQERLSVVTMGSAESSLLSGVRSPKSASKSFREMSLPSFRSPLKENASLKTHPSFSSKTLTPSPTKSTIASPGNPEESKEIASFASTLLMSFVEDQIDATRFIQEQAILDDAVILHSRPHLFFPSPHLLHEMGSTLVTISVRHCALTSIDSIAHLPLLKYLNVSNNRLADIPKELFHHSFLVHLFLDSNCITQWPILDEGVSMDLISEGSLSISSPLEHGIGDDSPAVEVLSEDMLSLAEPRRTTKRRRLGRRLEVLSVSHNHLDEVPEYITGFPNLKSLDLSFNDIHWLPRMRFDLTLEYMSLVGNPVENQADYRMRSQSSFNLGSKSLSMRKKSFYSQRNLSTTFVTRLLLSPPMRNIDENAPVKRKLRRQFYFVFAAVVFFKQHQVLKYHQIMFGKPHELDPVMKRNDFKPLPREEPSKEKVEKNCRERRSSVTSLRRREMWMLPRASEVQALLAADGADSLPLPHVQLKKNKSFLQHWTRTMFDASALDGRTPIGSHLSFLCPSHPRASGCQGKEETQLTIYDTASSQTELFQLRTGWFEADEKKNVSPLRNRSPDGSGSNENSPDKEHQATVGWCYQPSVLGEVVGPIPFTAQEREAAVKRRRNTVALTEM